MSAGKVYVNHYKRANQRDSKNWYIPEDKDLEIVSKTQILAKNVQVYYPLTVTRPRCIITQDVIDMIDEQIDTI